MEAAKQRNTLSLFAQHCNELCVPSALGKGEGRVPKFIRERCRGTRLKQQARANRVVTQARGRERGAVTIIACMHVSLFVDEQLERARMAFCGRPVQRSAADHGIGSALPAEVEQRAVLGQ